jgi:hypothetical protein
VPSEGARLGCICGSAAGLCRRTFKIFGHLGDNAIVVAEDNSLYSEWRMARIGEVALLEKPTDDRLPKRIDCYQVTEYSANGAAFKLDPARARRWLE